MKFYRGPAEPDSKCSMNDQSTPTATVPSAIRDVCANCHAPANDRLRFCTGCRQRKYCGQACQRAAWRAGHMEECRRLRRSFESSSSAMTAVSVSRNGSGEGEGAPLSRTGPSAAATSFGSSPRNKLIHPTRVESNGSAAADERNTGVKTHPRILATTKLLQII